VGRESFSRACQRKKLVLRIATAEPLAAGVRANLVTTLASPDGTTAATAPFSRSDARTLVCELTPQHPGLHSFRAEFSVDDGKTWLRDTVADAWVLIDPPQVDALRIYTLIPAASGTLADWAADLPRIRAMGFSAIHILPITAQDVSQSPYSARDLFDIDPSYLIPGSPRQPLEQLADFIGAAKSAGLRLCFDIVLNHIGPLSAMAVRAPDWITPDTDRPDGFRRARYWDDDAWRTWEDLVLINYEHPSESIRAEIWAYMTEYALFWAKFADDTGGFVRFDNLHSSDPGFVTSLTTALHAAYPEVGVLAEYFTDETTLLHTGPEWGLNLNLATPWSYKFAPELREYLRRIHRVSGQIRYFMPITSHDSGSPAQEFGSADSTVPRYVAAALLGTGATGVPQGVEFGERERINFIGRRAKAPRPDNARFGLFIGKVNAILADHAAFRCGENCRFIDGEHPAIIAAFRRDAEGAGYLVACNFDTLGPQRLEVDLSAELGDTGPFRATELLSGGNVTFGQPTFDIVLGPCEARVYQWDKRA
jgi:hypothetical protein